MPGSRALQRLSAQDHYSLVSDDLGWPWDIGVVAVLEPSGLLDDAGRLRIEAVRTVVGSTLHPRP